MRRFIVLVTVALLMLTILVASAGVAQAIRAPFMPGGGFSTSHTVCTTAVGINAYGLQMFEWRVGGEVCWINAPAQ